MGEIPDAVGGKFPDSKNRLYTDLQYSLSATIVNGLRGLVTTKRVVGKI